MNHSNNPIPKVNKQPNLFHFDIGIFDSYSNLNCSINLHEKSFRYYKCKKQMLTSFDPYYKLKQWAFKKIYFYSYKIKDNADSIFVPQQLYKGNLEVMAAFLKQLKKKKVESFISLYIINMDLGQKYQRLEKSISKIIRNVRSYFFRIICEGYSNKYKKTYIESTNPFVVTPKKSKPNFLLNTYQRKRHKSLSIQYTLIKVDSQTMNREVNEKHIHSLQTKQKKSKGLSIKILEQESKKIRYRFEDVGVTWSKKKLSKMNNHHQQNP